MMEVGMKMVKKEKAIMMGFEETELRLGLPGNGGTEGEGTARKRGFSEASVDLKLNLSSSKESSQTDPEEKLKNTQPKEKNLLPSVTDPAKPPAK